MDDAGAGWPEQREDRAVTRRVHPDLFARRAIDAGFAASPRAESVLREMADERGARFSRKPPRCQFSARCVALAIVLLAQHANRKSSSRSPAAARPANTACKHHRGLTSPPPRAIPRSTASTRYGRRSSAAMMRSSEPTFSARSTVWIASNSSATSPDLLRRGPAARPPRAARRAAPPAAAAVSASTTRGSLRAPGVHLAREHHRGGRRAADHRRARALDRDHLDVLAQRLREHHERAAVVARHDAEDDRARGSSRPRGRSPRRTRAGAGASTRASRRSRTGSRARPRAGCRSPS